MPLHLLYHHHPLTTLLMLTGDGALGRYWQENIQVYRPLRRSGGNRRISRSAVLLLQLRDHLLLGVALLGRPQPEFRHGRLHDLGHSCEIECRRFITPQHHALPHHRLCVQAQPHAGCQGAGKSQGKFAALPRRHAQERCSESPSPHSRLQTCSCIEYISRQQHSHFLSGVARFDE